MSGHRQQHSLVPFTKTQTKRIKTKIAVDQKNRVILASASLVDRETARLTECVESSGSVINIVVVIDVVVVVGVCRFCSSSVESKEQRR